MKFEPHHKPFVNKDRPGRALNSSREFEAERRREGYNIVFVKRDTGDYSLYWSAGFITLP